MDIARLAEHLVLWIREQVEGAGARGTVVGLSGGVDSAAVAALCQRAVPGDAHTLIMPCESDPADLEDARLVAATLGLEPVTIPLDGPYRALLATLPAGGPPERQRLALANLKPRLRMIAAYYYANSHGLLVVGTGNRSELHVGYFTKYGDGGVDLLPLAGLVKSQVRELARHLGIPERIITKPPTAGLWPGQTDEGEMGLTYADLDRYLLTGEAAPAVGERIERMHVASEHKRRLPAQPPPPPPENGRRAPA
ncbi:MAG: NAD(+) synthase [Firmicutes bacterium]|nr:NAD(+) synthase [Bacillota bacterium]